jgi:alkaline phosphatase D
MKPRIAAEQRGWARMKPSRREFLKAGLTGFAEATAVHRSVMRRWTAGATYAGIGIIQSSRPTLPQGVAAGDVGGGRGIVWSRCDRAARMIVEYSTSEQFTNARRVRGPAALESSDYTARTVLTDLPSGQHIFYRVTFQDLGDLRSSSEPVTGSFRTPPSAQHPRDVTLVWSADTVGQGWGINREWGGLRMYETMRRAEPDLFVHVGDTIYADQHLPPEIKLDDGTIWRNVVTPAKSKVAETLDEYRGNYLYNLLDEHMRRFNADVPQIVIWDDHEVRDNWYLERDLTSDDRYKVKSAALLAARARQAFFEYNPLPIHPDDPERIYRSIPLGPVAEVFALDLRTYRNANSANRQARLEDGARLLGLEQLEWLKSRLAASRATWKIVACDMPIGVIVRDGRDAYEAIANADAGPPLGRELEIADLLRFIRARKIRNVVWITGDIHYCAAHHYDPSRARFTDFDPFWEFVAGPLNAGTFGPNELDPTFGPEAKFNGVPKGMKGNRPPSDGLQFFGKMRVDARTQALTVTLHDLSGRTLHTVELDRR